MKTKNISYIALGVALILMIPFLTNAPWTLSDFIIGGALLFGAGILFEFLTSKVKTGKQKVIVGTVVLIGLVYIWAELAVGIFTDWGS